MMPLLRPLPGALLRVALLLGVGGATGLPLLAQEPPAPPARQGDAVQVEIGGGQALFSDGGELVITGTPAFFDGPQGAQRLPPLAQRLHTDFTTELFHNPFHNG